MLHSPEPWSSGSHLVSHPSYNSKYLPDKLAWTHIHLATVQGHDQADTLHLLAPMAISSLFRIGVRQLAAPGPPMYCTGFYPCSPDACTLVRLIPRLQASQCKGQWPSMQFLVGTISVSFACGPHTLRPYGRQSLLMAPASCPSC